jgi:lambda repressor-like predicted transcriptional regulator
MNKNSKTTFNPIELYKSGMSMRAISRGTGLSTQTIAKRLRIAGINLRVENWQKVSNDSLRDMYLSGMTMKFISAKTGLAGDTISNRLKKLKVKLRSIPEYVRTAVGNEVIVTKELSELIDGLLLGDGSISKGGRLSITQNGHRSPWVLKIRVQLETFGIKCKVKTTPVKKKLINERECFTKEGLRLDTNRYYWLRDQRTRWYPNGIKIVPKDINLSSVSIANWYMGDGTLCKANYTADFCTDSFTVNDVDFLIAKLANFNIHAAKTPRRKSFRIRVSGIQNLDKLKQLIEPHIHQCFVYKIDFPKSSGMFDKLLDEQKSEIKQLRLDGLTWREIAVRYNMSRVGICDAVMGRRDRPQQWTMSKPKLWTHNDDEIIMTLPTKDAITQLGRSRSSIYARRHKINRAIKSTANRLKLNSIPS